MFVGSKVRRVRKADNLTARWWRICQPYSPVDLHLQEDFWYSFLLEAE
jgi:hypothetical protein